MRPRRAAQAIVIAAFAVPAPAAASPTVPRTQALRLQGAIVREVNAVRLRCGLPVLRPRRVLALAAARQSGEQLGYGRLSHSDRAGAPFPERIQRYVRARLVAETIAWVERGTRPQAIAVVRMWMASAPHRGALLTRSFRWIGVGLATGALGPRRGTIVTADFASGA